MEAGQHLHLVALTAPSLRASIARFITASGAELVEFPHPEVLLAVLTGEQAAKVATHPGVRHIAPVGVNRNVHRLQVALREDGTPGASYVVRNNTVVRIAAGGDG